MRVLLLLAVCSVVPGIIILCKWAKRLLNPTDDTALDEDYFLAETLFRNAGVFLLMWLYARRFGFSIGYGLALCAMLLSISFNYMANISYDETEIAWGFLAEKAFYVLGFIIFVCSSL